MSDFIPILVEVPDPPPGPNMRGGTVANAGARALTAVVDVAADMLKERMGDLARILSDAAAAAPADSPFEVAELRFMMHLDANGEVSVMSLAKGAVTAGTGIEVTLRKRGAT